MNKYASLGPLGAELSAIDVYVGSRLAARRDMIRMSRETLAIKLHLPVGVVEAFELGMVRVKASTLYEVSQALRVPVAYFFQGYEIDAANDKAVDKPGSIS